MGLVADELVWKKTGAGKHPDVDGDGVGRELSVGDVTAMTVYMAAQETPTDAASAGDAWATCRRSSAEDLGRVAAGRKVFEALGCATCHTPEMPLLNTRFEEPTLRGRGQYYDAALAALDPGYDPKRPFAFDLLQDGAAAAGRGARRRRRHDSALRRPQAACDGPAARRSGGFERLGGRGPRSRSSTTARSWRFRPTSS